MFKEKFSEMVSAVGSMKMRTKIISGIVIVLLLLTMGIGINALVKAGGDDMNDKVIQENIKTAQKQEKKAKVEQKKAKDELEDAKSEEAKAKEELAEAQKSGDAEKIQQAQARVERATQVVQTAKNNYTSASQSVTNASNAVTEAKKPPKTGNTGSTNTGKTKKKVWIVDSPAKPAVKEKGHWEKKLVKEATTTTTYEDGMARYHFVGWTEADGYHKQKFYVHSYGNEESSDANAKAKAARDAYEENLTNRLIAIDDANFDKGIDTTYSGSIHFGQDYDYIKIPKTTTTPAEYKDVWVVDAPAKPAVPEKGHWEYR